MITKSDLLTHIQEGEKRLAKLWAQQDKLIDDFLDGGRGTTIFMARNMEFNTEIAELQKEIAEWQRILNDLSS